MNCCHTDEHKTENQKQRNFGHLAHILLMVLCCAAPALLMFFIPTLGNLIPGSARVITPIAPFLCLIMMVAMIPMMMRGRKPEPDAEAEQIQTNGTVQKGTRSESCH